MTTLKQPITRFAALCATTFVWGLACSGAESDADGLGGGSGEAGAAAAANGGSSDSSGSGGAGNSNSGGSNSGGSAGLGGSAGAAATSSGGANCGGTSGSGGAAGAAASGGSAGSGGGAGSGGSAGGGDSGGSAGLGGGSSGSGGGGGAGGTGGSGGTPSVDSDGCPIDIVGFATVDAMGQDGTYGGRDGQTVTVTNQSELEQYAGATEPYVIRVQGTITISPKGKEIRVASHKTIIGSGANAEISQGGFFLGNGTHNVILRNLRIGNTFVEGDWDGKTQDYDGIQMDTAHHVWIDHCDFHHIGDGMIDSRQDTTNLTVSWNILRDHNKAFGIGWTPNVTAEMTIHHNLFRDTGTRNPSTDNVLRAHLYNNWLLRAGGYGNYARGGTNMVLQNSVFEDMSNPHYYDTGSLVAIGNVYIDASGQRESSGSSFSFFDPSDFYDYSLDAADDVKDILTKCAGPRPTLGN